MVLKGFRFGMVLQLAIGPVCLLVFNTAVHSGFSISFPLVCAITLVDALFIIISGFGVGVVLKKPSIQKKVKVVGAIVLIFFGLSTIASAMDIAIIPSVNLVSNISSKDVVIQGILLTVSNPLTIVFWGGVLTGQIIENGYNRKQILWFGVGCMLSTFVFQTIIAYLGTIVSVFLSKSILTLLNIGVGAIIIYFGIKLLVKPVKE